jgi:ADP-heptose:LPS heptosyltransferase
MKILVVRFSSIGDVVLTTPVVRCIKTQLPNVQLHFITKKAFKSVLDRNPYIDQLITIERGIDEVVDLLKQEQYDFIVDLHNNVRTMRLKRSLKVKSAAFPKKNVAKFLLTKFKINRLPKVHVVDRYFEAVQALGVKNDRLPADFFLDETDGVPLSNYALEEKKFIAIAMGAQFATKQLPIDLLNEVLASVDCPIVLLGGEMDAQKAAELIALNPNQTWVNSCGTLNLKQSASLLKSAAVLLTGDTGLMHIASAFNIPIVSVWGNTVTDFGMYPYIPHLKNRFTVHEVNDLKCRPCSKIGYQACPKKHFQCMQMQNRAEISTALHQFLKD